MDSIFWPLVLACWGAFALVWLGGRIYNMLRGPRVERRSFSASVSLWLVGLVLVLLLLTRGSGLRFLRAAGALPLWAQALGAALLVLSTLFTVWARFRLGTMWSSLPEAKVGHELRTDGPYGVTRHPIYTGLIGMVLGSALVAGTRPWAVVAVLGVLVVLLKIPAEEKLMLETFGDGYRQYQQRVPQVIPGIGWLRHAR
jgi:protein-S-isoprenylcysteine O-methyltransferase Ste14